jgi:hypothetical protein
MAEQVDPARASCQAALDPLVVVEQRWMAHQHRAVVGPDRHRVIAEFRGASDKFLKAASTPGGGTGPDTVGGVDVHAVQREEAYRALTVHGQLEQSWGELVTGDDQIPVRREHIRGHRFGLICPSPKFLRPWSDRIDKPEIADVPRFHRDSSSTAERRTLPHSLSLLRQSLTS